MKEFVPLPPLPEIDAELLAPLPWAPVPEPLVSGVIVQPELLGLTEASELFAAQSAIQPEPSAAANSAPVLTDAEWMVLYMTGGNSTGTSD